MRTDGWAQPRFRTVLHQKSLPALDCVPRGESALGGTGTQSKAFCFAPPVLALGIGEDKWSFLFALSILCGLALYFIC